MTALPEPAPEPFDWQHPRVNVGGAEQRRELLQTSVDEWNANNPTIATPFGQENLPRADVMPSIQVMRGNVRNPNGTHYSFEQMWIDRFERDPDLMWQIIGDIVRYVSSDEIPRGTRTSSRRRVQDKDRNLQAVWRIIGPRYSMDPFPVAVRDLIGEHSIRWFGQKCGFGSPATLQRYMRGERPLTMDVLETMAKAGRVEPFFFVEYRAMWLARELQRAMLTRPNESVKAVKAVRDSVV